MTIWNRQAHTFSLLAAGSCVALAILLALAELYGLAAFLGFAGVVMYFAMMNRSFRRLRLSRQTIPDAWKKILQERVTFYRDLAPAGMFTVLSAAPSPVVTPQPINEARSRGMSSRIFTSERSGQSIFSAKEERFANCGIGSPPSSLSRGFDPLGRPENCVRQR